MDSVNGGLELEKKCAILMRDDLSLQGCVEFMGPSSSECSVIL